MAKVYIVLSGVKSNNAYLTASSDCPRPHLDGGFICSSPLDMSSDAIENLCRLVEVATPGPGEVLVLNLSAEGSKLLRVEMKLEEYANPLEESRVKDSIHTLAEFNERAKVFNNE